jgi:hypothetical protein
VNTDSARAARAAVRAALAAAVLAGTGALAGCVSGPSTQADVCGAYDDLGKQLMQGNGVLGNPLFHKADDLADVAKRYQATDLSTDAAALHRIAKSDSTSDQEIEQATPRIADLCGHPLGLGDLSGT